MLLAILAVLMTSAVAWALVRPLRQSLAPPPPPEGFNLSVYRDQLEEVDRDLARGAITEAEAEGARAEIGRRMLQAGATPSDLSPPPVTAPRWAATALAVALAAGAGGTYLAVGKPGAPDRPLAVRNDVDQAIAGGEAMHGEMAEMVKSLSAKLEKNPEDPQGWALMARSLMNLERFGEAVDAYRRAMKLTNGADGALSAEYAEALVISNDGAVVPESRAIFERMLREEPGSPQARYYLALAKVQSGDTPGGLRDWKALLAETPADAPWRETLMRQIATAEGRSAPETTPEAIPTDSSAPRGPSAADVAAASKMSDSDRNAMIEGMVAQLAARLEDNPRDLDGWRRLARAYGVLGRKSDAAKAHQKVLGLAPNDADALWNLGDFARESGDAAGARRYWSQLMRALPAGSPERSQVQNAISALPS